MEKIEIEQSRISREDFKIESHYENEKHLFSNILVRIRFSWFFNLLKHESWTYIGHSFGEDSFRADEFESVEKAEERIQELIKMHNKTRTIIYT